MKFTCDRCGKRYSSVDEPIPGRVYRVRCRCGNAIQLSTSLIGARLLGEDVAPASPTPQAAPPRSASTAGAAGAPVRRATPAPGPTAGAPARPGAEPPWATAGAVPAARGAAAPGAPAPTQARPAASRPVPAPARTTVAAPSAAPLSDDPFAAVVAPASRGPRRDPPSAAPATPRPRPAAPAIGVPSPEPQARPAAQQPQARPAQRPAPPQEPEARPERTEILTPREEEVTAVELSVSEQLTPAPRRTGRRIALAALVALIAVGAGAAAYALRLWTHLPWQAPQRAAVARVEAPGAPASAPAQPSSRATIPSAPPPAPAAPPPAAAPAPAATREVPAAVEREAAPLEPAVAEALQKRTDEAPAPKAPPGALPDGLDPTQLQTVIRANRAALAACVDQARADPATAAYAGRKVSLLILVAPTGHAEAALDEPDLDASPLGACLRRATGKMTFPAFRGEPVGTRVPLALGRNGPPSPGGARSR